MGQKVNPHGFRVGVNKEWSSSWIADRKEFSNYLVEDNKIRKYIDKKHAGNGISKVVIERTNKRLTVDIYTSKPGIVIGMKGAGVEELKNDIAKICENKNVNINIKEVKRPDLDAALVAESIAVQLEKRVSFRRAMKQAMQRVMKAGAVGCKVMVGGRLDGAEIARSEHYHEGRLPLHTIRADIDYATHEAHTTFGVIGIKVWICKGEILNKKAVTADTTANVGGDELC
ncbi:MAG: 30S ribosomal protein S3 [Clostridiales bacterium]|nr:30S ribosomal protein S3 [Clostridiales bacterium]